MKALEAYLKKEYPHINSGDEMFAWDIWKTALERALEESDCMGDPANKLPVCEIKTWINKELEEK